MYKGMAQNVWPPYAGSIPLIITSIAFTLDDRAFAFWDVKAHGWTVEPGEFELRLGTSSRDIRHRLTIDR